jgi:hypothetical protein
MISPPPWTQAHLDVERDLQVEIDTGMLPFDVVAYFVFGTCIWVVLLWEWWP